jgi:hypothetical protein
VSGGKERAERLLVHYIRLSWERAGLGWDSDNEAEVGSIIDALHDMVIEEIRWHAKNAPHIYRPDDDQVLTQYAGPGGTTEIEHPA